MSIALCASAQGTKLSLVVLIPRKRYLTDLKLILRLSHLVSRIFCNQPMCVGSDQSKRFLTQLWCLWNYFNKYDDEESDVEDREQDFGDKSDDLDLESGDEQDTFDERLETDDDGYEPSDQQSDEEYLTGD